MDESQISAELGFLESLKEEVLRELEYYLTPDLSFSRYERFMEVAERLLDSYNQEYSRINNLIGFDSDTGLQYVEKPKKYYFGTKKEWYAALSSLIPQIDKGIMGLRSKISPLSLEEAKELKILREGLQEILLELPEEYGKNIEEAIKEFEKGCFLGSALISGRIIQYVFDRIPGGDIQEKIKTLKERGLVEKNGAVPPEYILKADKKARNYFSHDIKAFPDRSDALELLLICNRLLKLLRIFQQHREN